MLHRHGRYASVVIDKIDIERIAICEPEDDPPIARHGQRPEAGAAEVRLMLRHCNALVTVSSARACWGERK